MKRFLLVLGLVALPAVAAWGDETPSPPACGVVDQDQGTVTLACSGVTPEFGAQLAQVLTAIVQRRLDPQQVLDKLADIESAPVAGVARTLGTAERQLVIQSLYGKPAQQIAIVADPAEDDAGDYGKSIAAPLAMVGWHITGNQITRKALPGLDEVRGVALLVRDAAAPPQAATELKAALSAAHIVAPLRPDPTLGADATVLWIGKRPIFDPDRQPKS